MPLALLLALAAAPHGLGLRLEETGEIATDEAVALTRALATDLEARCGTTVAIDDPLWSGCTGQEPCVEAIRGRTGGGDVVLVRVFGGLTKTRVVTERFTRGEASARRVEVDVPRAAEGWSAPLSELAARLCPEGQVSQGTGSPELVAPVPAEVTEAPPRVLPWIFGGTSVALVAVGAVFGASSAGARADAADPMLTDAAFDALADRTQAHAITADVLFVAAGVSAVTGLVLALIE